MIVFTTSDYFQKFVPPLLSVHPGLSEGKVALKHVLNGELAAHVEVDVAGKTCLLIGSVAPPDKQLTGFLIIADALKRNGARYVRAFLPYLGYTRQDTTEAGGSGGIAFVGALFRAAGIDDVITIDIHSELARHRLGLPTVSLASAPLFYPTLKDIDLSDVTFVAPYEEALPRVQALADAAGYTKPITFFKRQVATEHGYSDIVGDVTRKVILADDMLDSGKRIVSTCERLGEKGVKEITAFMTHGLFSGEVWDQIFWLGVKALYVTDSCPEVAAQKHKELHVIPIDPLLPSAIHQIVKRDSPGPQGRAVSA